MGKFSGTKGLIQADLTTMSYLIISPEMQTSPDPGLGVVEEPGRDCCGLGRWLPPFSQYQLRWPWPGWKWSRGGLLGSGCAGLNVGEPGAEASGDSGSCCREEGSYVLQRLQSWSTHRENAQGVWRWVVGELLAIGKKTYFQKTGVELVFRASLGWGRWGLNPMIGMINPWFPSCLLLFQVCSHLILVLFDHHHLQGMEAQ